MPVTIDYGTRLCLACAQDVPAERFGEHMGDHDPRDWPGGTPAMLQAMSDSLDESIRRAEGHRVEVERLQRSQGYVHRLQALAAKLPIV